jgi:2-polyprenyl-6-methoxyphenol hydroxylase-like FAD-dependent oxidoreductase
MTIKTEVLIVGAGPVGQGLAIELGLRGIACMVIDRNDRVGVAPRAKTTNVRSREHFRRWGMADKLRDASPFGVDYPSNIVFTTRLSGHQLAKFDNALYCAPGRNPLYSEHAQWIPQYKVEQVMRDHLQGIPSVELRLQCQLYGIEQRDDAVLATIGDPDGGEQQVVEARFLVGCDGARSSVREVIGARMEGKYGLSRNYNFVFRAPGLEHAHPHGKAIMYWQINEDLPSIIGPMDDGDRWYFMPTALPPGLEITRDTAPDYIRKATGIDLPYEILSADEWVASELLATHYRDRRVFIAGDAAHLHPPFGGFGMNMGIGDAVDLGWKLAAVLQGWGGAGLLDSYQHERRKVHKHVMEQATANHALLGGSLLSPGLEDDTSEGQALRAATGQRIRGAKLSEFYTLGTILGDCYAGSPIIAGAGAEAAEGAPPRDFLNYVPRAQAGCRAPHAWLHDGSSLFDHFGAGFTLLVSTAAAMDDAARACRDAARYGIPLKVLRQDNGGVCQLYAEPLTLIRPDQHIAWTGAAWPDAAGPDVFAIVAGHNSHHKN